MKYLKSILCFIFVMTTGVGLAQVQLRDDYPQTYVVQPGDTLWDISAKYLDQAWMWPEIWQANQQIANPHLIYPGDVLSLIYVDGQPRLALNRGDVKLSPQIRESAEMDAIRAINLDSIRQFLKGHRVLQEGEADGAPYMVAGESKRVLVGGGDQLYARGTFDPTVSVYGVYRIGEPYEDPVTGETLGVRAAELAMIRKVEVTGEIGQFSVNRSSQEMSQGDVLLPYEDEIFDPVFYPAPPTGEVNGLILSVEGGLAFAGKNDILALNLGESAGLKSGHVLKVMQKGELVKDRVEGGKVTIPDFTAGLVMVFKTYPNMSYGIVLEAQREISVGDKIKSP